MAQLLSIMFQVASFITVVVVVSQHCGIVDLLVVVVHRLPPGHSFSGAMKEVELS